MRSMFPYRRTTSMISEHESISSETTVSVPSECAWSFIIPSGMSEIAQTSVVSAASFSIACSSLSLSPPEEIADESWVDKDYRLRKRVLQPCTTADERGRVEPCDAFLTPFPVEGRRVAGGLIIRSRSRRKARRHGPARRTDADKRSRASAASRQQSKSTRSSVQTCQTLKVPECRTVEVEADCLKFEQSACCASGDEICPSDCETVRAWINCLNNVDPSTLGVSEDKMSSEVDDQCSIDDISETREEIGDWKRSPSKDTFFENMSTAEIIRVIRVINSM